MDKIQEEFEKLQRNVSYEGTIGSRLTNIEYYLHFISIVLKEIYENKNS